MHTDVASYRPGDQGGRSSCRPSQAVGRRTEAGPQSGRIAGDAELARVPPWPAMTEVARKGRTSWEFCQRLERKKGSAGSRAGGAA